MILYHTHIQVIHVPTELRRVIFVGASGTGKTSLLNAVLRHSPKTTPDLGEIGLAAQSSTQHLLTQPLGRTRQGRHTTSTTRLWRTPILGNAGTSVLEIVDSPGFQNYVPIALSQSQLVDGFPEIKALTPKSISDALLFDSSHF